MSEEYFLIEVELMLVPMFRLVGLGFRVKLLRGAGKGAQAQARNLGRGDLGIKLQLKFPVGSPTQSVNSVLT